MEPERGGRFAGKLNEIYGGVPVSRKDASLEVYGPRSLFSLMMVAGQ